MQARVHDLLATKHPHAHSGLDATKLPQPMEQRNEQEGRQRRKSGYGIPPEAELVGVYSTEISRSHASAGSVPNDA